MRSACRACGTCASLATNVWNCRAAVLTPPMETLRRIVYLIFRPQAEWDLIADEKTSVDAAAAPLHPAAGAARADRDDDRDEDCSTASGIRCTATSCPPSRYSRPARRRISASIGSIFALAAIFALLAPMFGSPRDYRRLAQGRDVRDGPRDARRRDAADAGDGDRRARGLVPHAVPAVARRAPRAERAGRRRRPSSSAFRSCC